MIGSKYIEINWKNWVQGMTTSNFTEDGGFSIGIGGANISSVNPLITAGVLNFPASPTDKSTSLTGQFIASCEDTTGTYARLLVSRDESNGDGRFYTSVSDGTLTQRGSNDSASDYIQGKTDIVSFDGEAYVTNAANLVRWQLPATLNFTFFAFSDAAAPHPALVYENNAFYGDGNLLLRQTAAGAAPTTILTLPTNQVIVTLGIDPGSGKMLLSIVDELNLSGTLNAQARVGYYDGFSNKLIKVVLADEMITCFYNVGGTLFIGYGQKFGYWTGTGIQFLRKLNIALTNEELLYKHHITNIGQIVYLLEKNKILAFGEIVQGKGRSWWYLRQNAPAGSPVNMTFLTYMSSNILVYSYATSQFFTIDTSSSASHDANGILFTRKYDFPRNITFNNLVIDFESALTANVTAGTVYLFPDDGSTPLIATVVTTQSGILTFQCPWPTQQLRSFQIRYISSTNLGIERMTIFYNDKD
jgi:hypothetical protein